LALFFDTVLFMSRKGYPEDEPASRPRAIPAHANMGTADDDEEGEPDSRLLDLESQQESPFLRAQKRVQVRRGPLPKKAAHRLKSGVLILSVGAVLALSLAGLSRYGQRSWRFRLDSSEQIQLVGNRNVSRAQVLEVFGGDISRNVLLIPLAERKRQLEQIPWIESATVMRLLPNRLSVEVRERTPMAFARVGAQIKLIDRSGVLMDAPPGMRFSFPVILGFTGAEPLSSRVARIGIYQAVMHDLDSGGSNYSRNISEIDLADPEDVKIVVTDQKGEVLIHLGSGNFLERYKIYEAHIQEWRRQFQEVDSVDLRYDRQVIVNADMGKEPAPAPPETHSPPQPVPPAAAHAPPAPTAKKPSALHSR
jgi:cell division protein FtsQ